MRASGFHNSCKASDWWIGKKLICAPASVGRKINRRLVLQVVQHSVEVFIERATVLLLGVVVVGAAIGR